ncbi:glyoxalase [Stenotrophomonas terrae]|uniref:Glyoxalase n=1 Tax=Stenotrophomonas terrae TaxID=405446 RepID=A0A0R0D1J3_9GAMM|nr:VOC family protein [Stenotrophomonas terrae]KRG71860.1 glyoxalase [Stenotrophomonas terrae]
MKRERRIDYVEFASRDPAASRRFFEQVFGWQFEDYGPDYTAFDDGELQGGFFRATPLTASAGAPLIVLYAAQLEPVLAVVAANGGDVIKPIFSFPGGRRFQFIEPGGNELAVWSERDHD